MVRLGNFFALHQPYCRGFLFFFFFFLLIFYFGKEKKKEKAQLKLNDL